MNEYLDNYEYALLTKAYEQGYQYVCRINLETIAFSKVELQNKNDEIKIPLFDMIMDDDESLVMLVPAFDEFGWTEEGEEYAIAHVLQLVNWNEVEVDTLVKVKQDKDGEWALRYFASYEPETDTIETFAFGTTSKTMPKLAVKERYAYFDLAE